MSQSVSFHKNRRCLFSVLLAVCFPVIGAAETQNSAHVGVHSSTNGRIGGVSNESIRVEVMIPPHVLGLVINSESTPNRLNMATNFDGIIQLMNSSTEVPRVVVAFERGDKIRIPFGNHKFAMIIPE